MSRAEDLSTFAKSLSISNNQVTLDNTNLGSSVVLGTTSSPIANNLVFADGKGIDFSSASGSASGSSSALLNDYEEGTYSPTLTGSGGGAWVTNIQGNYIKIGNLVWAKISIVNPGTTYNNLSGSWRFSLPFTQASFNSHNYMGGYVSYSRHIPTITNGSTLALSLYDSLAWVKWLKSNTDEAGDVSGNLHQNTLFGGTILYKTI